MRPLLAFLPVLFAVVLAAPLRAQDAAPPKNVILMIADGFGPASATMARVVAGRPLALDTLLGGSVATASTDSEVTDSAAGATAYSCGLKTFNGAIAVDSLRRPCRTLLEAAEARGMATGLVATSRVTHATPAAFAAHVADRGEEAEIAAQMITSGVDVLLGGGRRFFLPEAAGGTREDGRDLLAELGALGYAVATDRAGFEAIRDVPAAALLAPGHLAYEIDREETDQPALAALTEKALALLGASEAGRTHGFFLMVEGSRIDHAAHANDPAGTARDVLAYDAAVAAALDFARRDGRTLVVSVADHETGGLTLGRDDVYDWDPAYLASVRASFDRIGARVEAGEDPVAVAVDAFALDSLRAGEAARLRDALARRDGRAFRHALRDAVSTRAGIGWTTGGHTGVDVNLYRFGPGSARLHGQMANDAVGRVLFDLLGAEPAVAEAPLGPPVTSD